MSAQDNNSKIAILYGGKCKRCGAGPEGLNVEGHIHHNCPLECIDRKACNKRIRRGKK